VTTKQDHFAGRAADWDKVAMRVENVENIARAMRRQIRFADGMHLMDFGSGTGLLLERIAPLVGRITAVDTSQAMNEQLAEKRGRLPCELDIVQEDLLTLDLGPSFDGIISSMTLHHVEDIDRLFRVFFDCLKPGGFIALADLDSEDGQFHPDATGVFHHGFDRHELREVAQHAGFDRIEIQTASVIHKPEVDYPVFLLTACRPAPD
jgi:cyclopropane fatty-acyl-phospholipid synthase-like methyltransferase